MPDDSLLDLAEYIEEKLEDRITSYEFLKNELVIHAKSESIAEVLQFLRNARECEFTVLCDICAVDYVGRPLRFDVVYSLLSMRQNNRARVKVALEEDASIPSVVSLFSSALWYEREIWDMFGIVFSGNTDLRRILTDYGFEGHPLRKDFPLSGHVEVCYDAELRRVVYKPVKLTQNYRDFDYVSPWEGMRDIQLAQNKKGSTQAHGAHSADVIIQEEYDDEEEVANASD